MADGPRLYARRVGETLVLQPDDVWTADRITDFLKADRPIMVKTETARNIKQHKLAWGLAHKIAENSEVFDTAEQVMAELKRKTGHFDLVQAITQNGELIQCIELRSISFAAMKQEDFEPWFERVLDVVVAEIWPSLTKLKIRAELDAMIGITPSGKAIQRKRKAAAVNETA